EPQPLLGTFFFSALRVEDFLPYFFFLVQQYCLADPRTGEWHSVTDTGAHLGPSQAGYFVDVENILVVSDRQVNGVLVFLRQTLQDGPRNEGDRVLLEGEKTVFDQGRTERIRIFPTLAQVPLGGQQLQQPMGRAPAHPRHLHDLLQIRGPFGDCGDHPQASVERLGTWRCRALGVHGSQIRQRPCFGGTTGHTPHSCPYIWDGIRQVGTLTVYLSASTWQWITSWNRRNGSDGRLLDGRTRGTGLGNQQLSRLPHAEGRATPPA